MKAIDRYRCDVCGGWVQDPAPKPPMPMFRYTDSVRQPGIDMCKSCFCEHHSAAFAERTGAH